MPEPEFEALFKQYPAVIDQMKETFTSHDFILCLAQRNQRAYVKALFRYRDATAPFRRVHSILARHLHAYPAWVELVRRDAPSVTIFGQPETCAEWRRVSRVSQETEDHHLSIDQQHEHIFQRIDGLVARIHQFQVEPDLSDEVKARSDRTPDFELPDDAILKRLISLIAYSNNARAEAVSQIVRSGVLDIAFRNYDVSEVVHLEPAQIVEEYWPQIKGIRFKYKIDRMIECARCLQDIGARHGSFMQYLRAQNIPMSIQAMADVQSFWDRFDVVAADLRAMRMPYFRNLTSLCHLLLHMGYDCAKPDSGVMKAATKLRIAPQPRRKGAFSDNQRRMVVQFMQLYAAERGIRVPVVDLYFLIHGGQTGVSQLVQTAYYL